MESHLRTPSSKQFGGAIENDQIPEAHSPPNTEPTTVGIWLVVVKTQTAQGARYPLYAPLQLDQDFGAPICRLRHVARRSRAQRVARRIGVPKEKRMTYDAEKGGEDYYLSMEPLWFVLW